MGELLGPLQPFLTGLLIGFVIGLERERSHQAESQAMGVRTFTLIGLLGATAGVINSDTIATLITLFVLMAILLGYLRSTRHRPNDVGLTTEMSAGVVFVLSYLGTENRELSYILAALTLGLLVAKRGLHQFTREKITQEEAEAFTTLIVLGVAILPFLPSKPVDPWGVVVPLKLGTLVFLLALVQFVSYALLKVFGERAGALLGGFLAGLASSTAAFVNIRQQLNSPGDSSRRDLLTYGMMAIFASLLQMFVIVFLNSQETALHLGGAFILASLICIVIAILGLVRKSDKGLVQREVDQDPLNLRKQLSFALALFVVMALTNLAKQFFGDSAFLAVSFVSGLFELHGVTFAVSSLPFSEKTAWALRLAFLASLISKGFIIVGAKEPRVKYLIMAALGALGIAFLMPVLF